MPPGITDKDYIIAQYDGEVAYMDAAMQTIFTALESHGIMDETLVVVNSDHGETLYDHECYFDHHGIYDTVLHVPLIIRWPRDFSIPEHFKPGTVDVRERADLRGVRGCNLGIWRDDLVQVNGYNEAFVCWGREDSELALRLMIAGIRRLDARGWALCYHLWHPPAGRARLEQNDELLAHAQREGANRCERGLDQDLHSATS